MDYERSRRNGLAWRLYKALSSGPAALSRKREMSAPRPNPSRAWSFAFTRVLRPLQKGPSNSAVVTPLWIATAGDLLDSTAPVSGDWGWRQAAPNEPRSAFPLPGVSSR